jgi:phosphotransacetylase
MWTSYPRCTSQSAMALAKSTGFESWAGKFEGDVLQKRPVMASVEATWKAASAFVAREAARVKGIRSAVAGDPDILLLPDLEAGNILAKQLTFMAGADAAGVVIGARVPIVLTSRADSVRARLASCAATLVHRRDPPA